MRAGKGTMAFTATRLAIPAALVLMLCLSILPQLLLRRKGFQPLDFQHTVLFNVLTCCVLTCYSCTCLTDPGIVLEDVSCLVVGLRGSSSTLDQGFPRRWCRKCDRWKPPRAHHCRECQRCIPKMDHHCVWVSNCVSHRTFPHFFRLLLYAVLATIHQQYFLTGTLYELWKKRKLPSYHGPSIFHLSSVVALALTNLVTLFTLSILFIRTLWSLLTNTTTIEEWEIERHNTLVRRSRKNGGYLYGPGGREFKIEKQEFPYDLGVWKNCTAGMGTRNVFMWFWPLGGSYPLAGGIEFEVNDIEDEEKEWPPMDPDRSWLAKDIRTTNSHVNQRVIDYGDDLEVEAFRQRQADDMRRRQQRMEFREYPHGLDRSSVFADAEERIRGWKNSEGERLQDFGVDE